MNQILKNPYKQNWKQKNYNIHWSTQTSTTKIHRKDKAKYNEAQKKVYERIKNDEERIQKRQELSRENQRKYAEIRKQERLARGEVVRPRGRPKKAKTQEPDKK